MAGHYEADLCRVIVEERFGTTVSLVFAALLREPCYFSGLVHNLKGQFSVLTIRKSVAVLEQFGLVKFKLDSTSKILYTVDVETVTALLKAPRCFAVIEKLYGNIYSNAGDIFLRIFYAGRLSCSETIKRVVKNAQNIGQPVAPETVKSIFCRMAETQFLIRCPAIEHSLHGCPLFPSTSDLFTVPDNISTEDKDNDDNTSRKRKHVNNSPDYDIYWRINFNRFDRYFRDELIQAMVVPKNWTGDEKSSEICKQTLSALLKSNETRVGALQSTSSTPISAFEITKTAHDYKLPLEKSDLDWALRVLVEDGRGVIRKAGDSGGGLYVIDFDRAIRLSCQQHLECLIREQLDTKAVRVFRLLQSKGYLEEEQIEKLTMMNAKETRELLFAMQEEGYVFTKPIGKTQDFAPARTFYLYYVDLTKIVRGLLEYTCKSLRNIILRRKKEVADHKFLVDKNSKMEYIIDEIREAEDKDEETKETEIADVKETYMPGPDMATYEKFLQGKNMLDKAEVETERVLMTFRVHLLLSKQTVPT